MCISDSDDEMNTLAVTAWECARVARERKTAEETYHTLIKASHFFYDLLSGKGNVAQRGERRRKGRRKDQGSVIISYHYYCYYND